MKLTHQSKAGKQDDAQAHPKQQNAARPKRNPFSFLKHAAGSLALASAITAGSLAAPKPAAAQEIPPLSAFIASDSNSSTQLYFSFLRYGFGIGYHYSVLHSVSNLPLAVRNVPVNSQDLGGMDSSWAQPIGDLPLIFPDDIPFLNLSIGPALSFNHGTCVIQLGAGGEFSAYNENMNERNYLDSNNAPTAGDSASFYRGYVTALTWDGIEAGPVQLFDEIAVKPYIFAEIQFTGSDRQDGSAGISFGYRLYRESVIGENGWDRWDSYQVMSTYNLATYVTGMPYVGLNFYDEGHIQPVCQFLFGFKYVVSSHVYAAGQGTHLDFSSPAFTFDLSIQPHF